MDTGAYFGKATCLLVFLKSCTVTLNHSETAHFSCRASSADGKHTVIGF